MDLATSLVDNLLFIVNNDNMEDREKIEQIKQSLEFYLEESQETLDEDIPKFIKTQLEDET